MTDAAPPYVAVVGPAEASEELCHLAAEVGRHLAYAGAVVVTGGLGGVMAAASRGASDAGGRVVGLLPGADRAAANEWVDVAIATGLGELRNTLVVRATDAVIAVGGSWGTLSEVALARRAGRRVVGLRMWRVSDEFGAALPDGVEDAETADDAVRRALSADARA